MNFGEEIKSEIFSKLPKERHCKKAFLTGLLRGAGEIFEENDELGLGIKVVGKSQAQQVCQLIKSLFDYEIQDVSIKHDKLNNRENVYLSVKGENATEILRELDVIIGDGEEMQVNLKFYGEITEKECCLRSFIKGLFVSSGKCTIPNLDTATKTGYHLEIGFSHYTPALNTSEMLAKFNVLTKITRRKESFIVYIKSAEEIKDFIAFLPAPVSVLKLTDFMIERGLSNNSNRQKNCDLGNVNRQIEATLKQVEAIEIIENTIGLDTLKQDLKTTAIARKEFREDTLNELAERLNVSKSCLNHRLRKLAVIAKELQQ